MPPCTVPGPQSIFPLVLAVLLTAFDVGINIIYNEEIFQFLVNACTCGWYRDRDILLTIYCDPDVLRIGALLPGITLQGLGSCGELICLGSSSHVVDVNFEVLC